ncbi:MAG: hypothetical protein IJM66_02805 [Muribaculaceae bacterium]|nr:hypothetical protein [Muribaculaceae bacterium]
MKKQVLILAFLLAGALGALACTSAIISGSKTASGRPLLWKHRDTGCPDNRVELIKAHDNCYEFVAIFDATDPCDTAAWTGFNETGFAIMNTASYNLNNDDIPESQMDREGVVMKLALEHCATVNDFEQLLLSLPMPLGVEANFGVIDAQGHGAYFETGNYSFKRFNLEDAPNGVLTRTNYSYSGRPDEGMGYVRETSEKYLLAPHIAAADFTPALFTEEISRTFYHSLLGKDFTHSGDEWIVDQDFIPRRLSTASIVIEGVSPGESPALTTMWIALGYPPCAETFAARLGAAGGVPVELNGTTPDNHSPQCDIVKERKAQVFSIERGNGQHYLNLSKLYNNAGTGYCQQLVKKNLEMYKREYEKRNALKSQLKTTLKKSSKANSEH